MGLCANCQSLAHVTFWDKNKIKECSFYQIQWNEVCDRCGWKRK